MKDCGRFQYEIPKLKDPLLNAFTKGSVLFSDGFVVTEDNANFFWDDTNNRLGIGINSGMPALPGLSVLGHIDLLHTASDNDEHALELAVDAAGFGDVRGFDLEYETGAISTGEAEAAILVDINEFDATGGEIFGMEVLATSGGADAIFAIKAGAVVGPILQESGTFANPTTGTNDTPSTDVPDMIDGSTGTNTTIFVADNDYILIGAAAAFTEIEFNIETPAANPGIKPTFGYSIAGSHQFTAFSPTDGTNGFRNSGVIAWDAADLASHVTNDDTGTFDIKITRTHAVAGSVSLFFAKTAETVVYSWDKDGDITAKTLTLPDTGEIFLGNTNQFLHATSATGVTLNAATSIALGIAGSPEVRIQTDNLFFVHATGPSIESGFNWATLREIDVFIDGTAEVTFTDGTIEPVLDSDIDLGTASLRFQIGYLEVLNASHATDPTAEVGNFWYNEAENAHKLECLAGIFFDVCAFQGPIADSVVSDTTTKTAFTQTYTIKANSLIARTTYEFWFSGELTTDATMNYEWSLAGGAVLTMRTGTASQTTISDEAWFVHGYFTCRSIGLAGTIQCNAQYGIPGRGGNVVSKGILSTHDTTQDITIAAQVEMGLAGAGKTCTMKQFILKKVT